MSRRPAAWLYCAALATALTLVGGDAQAYVGPGVGLGTIIVVLGVIGSVFVAIFAILWYPVKRLLKRRKAEASAKQQPLKE